MFSHELGVQGQQFDGTEYALFAPREAVDTGGRPLASGQIVPGFVRVRPVERDSDLVLVELPGQTFQDGSFITVFVNQLATAPHAAAAPP
jgi:hypothetical protein